MYLSIDIGASKTLVGLFSKEGDLKNTIKFSTPKKSADFFTQFKTETEPLLKNQELTAMSVAVAGPVKEGVMLSGGRLKWKNVNFKKQLESDFNIPVTVKNDAALGGLAEALLGAGKDYRSALYVTISTGVGTTLTIDGRLPEGLETSEGGQMLIPDHNGRKRLEDLVSGPALKHRFGKYGYEITDPMVWDQFAKDLAIGLFNMATLINPSVIILGGGVSVHFDKFIDPLKKYLKEHDSGLLPLPPVFQAKYVETAVIYGGWLALKDETNF